MVALIMKTSCCATRPAAPRAERERGYGEARRGVPISRTFGRRFKELLAAAGDSQYAAAEKLGVSQSYISQLARGTTPSRELAVKLARAYELDEAEWLALAGYGPDFEESDPLEEVARRAGREGAREALREAGLLPGAAAGTPPLTYEPVLDEVDVRCFKGAEGLPPGDIEVVNRILRDLLAEHRRKRGLD